MCFSIFQTSCWYFSKKNNLSEKFFFLLLFVIFQVFPSFSIYFCFHVLFSLLRCCFSTLTEIDSCRISYQKARSFADSCFFFFYLKLEKKTTMNKKIVLFFLIMWQKNAQKCISSLFFYLVFKCIFSRFQFFVLFSSFFISLSFSLVVWNRN